MLFQQALHQTTHTGAGAFFFLPVSGAILAQCIGQLFCNSNQFVVLVEVFDGLRFD